MHREVRVPHPALEAITTILRLGAALSSGFNALYFLAYRGVTPRRRIGTLVLALVNLAFLVQAMFGGPPFRLGQPPAADIRLAWLLALLPLLAASAISGLVLWQLRHRRRK